MLYSNLPELPIIAKPELSAKALNGEANYEIIQQSQQQNQGKSTKEIRLNSKSQNRTIQKIKPKEKSKNNYEMGGI